MFNMGLGEWIIVLIILMVFGGPIVAALGLQARRRPSAPTPPFQAASTSPSDQEKMQRILDALERMERRIENLETVMGQEKTEGRDTPLG